MTGAVPEAQRPTPAELFATHRSAPYAELVRATADLLPSDLTGTLIVLHAVRAASFQGRATDPWLASAAEFRSDVERLDEDIARARAAGLVQFTEPMRLADLLPGLLIAASSYPGTPLRLVELGSCAGLLLWPEAYRIDYPGGSWSPPTARTRLASDLQVPGDLLTTDLTIADRVGIDLSPVDPRTAHAFDHLRSFSWAGEPAREVRLGAALAAVAPEPSALVAADATDALPDLLAERVSRDVVTVVIESGLSTYLSGRQSLALGQVLDAHACRGPLLLITRGRSLPACPELPNSISIVDLSARWRWAYAGTDLLSERTRWVPPP